MGDSTMADKDLSDGKPERGWGMMFPNFVDSTLHVINYAQNGRSTKSFIDKGLWDKVYNALQPGDYVFIEFGHNDAKADDPARYAAPFGAYQDNLRTFIRGAREKGATPILCSPVANAGYGKKSAPDATFKLATSRRTYGDYAKAVAEEKKLAYVDMTALTAAELTKVGRDAALALYLGDSKRDGKPIFDTTHPNKAGAKRFAELFVADVKARKLPVASLFK